LHPLIRRESRARIAAARQPYVILVVPLLLETGAYRDLIKRVLVVDCDEAQQIARATRRSGLSAAEVRAIMTAQVAGPARLAAADDVLRNDADLKRLRRDAEALHAKYLALTRQSTCDASDSG
jgi:dephospho-CoA kinase